MWKTEKDAGLSQQEIDVIVERLWIEETCISTGTTCPDCGVNSGEVHTLGCDLGHCIHCGEQTLFEECECGEVENDNWTGIWPGTKEAYSNKLICYWSLDKKPHWRFDLNRATIIRLNYFNK